MKLNKMLALALSGVMAVSMLAGCSGAPSNGEEGDKEQQVVVSDAAATLNKMQKVVDFDGSSTLDNYMKAVETLKPSQVKLLTEDNYASDVAGLSVTGNTVTAIKKVMSYVDAQNVAADFDAFDSAEADNKDDVTKTVFYAVKADDILSIEHIMTKLEGELGVDDFKSYVEVNDDEFAVGYAGSVSVVKVSKTDEDNKTYNAYVIGVSITRTVGDAVNVSAS